MRTTPVLAFVLFSILLAAPASGQTGQGEIAGFLTDESGKAITDASITIESESLLGTIKVMTNSSGYYRAIKLPPGRYTLKASKENYRSKAIEGISVRAGKTSSLNIVLEVGEFAEVITIQQDAPLIDTESADRSLNIDGDFITRMPLSPQREWAQVWSVVPGVDFAGSYTPGDSGSMDQIIVNGQSSTQNKFNLDGMNIGQVQWNRNSVTFSPEIIEDVEVVTAGQSAQLSTGTGGYINVVTKSGGNDFSGSLAFTFQPESWNWSNVEGGSAPELTSYVPEASFGGPIIRDRTWFFLGYRYDRRVTGITRLPENLALFDQFDLPRPNWDTTRSGHRLFAKVTHSLSESDKLVFSYNRDRVTEENVGTLFPGRATVETTNDKLSGGNYYQASWDHAWSNMSLSVKASYNDYEFGDDVSDQPMPRLERFGNFLPSFIGPFGLGPSVFHNGSGNRLQRKGEQVELRADFSRFIDGFYGTHDLQIGVEARPHSVATAEQFMPSAFSEGADFQDAQGNWVVGSATVLDTGEGDIDARFGSETYGGYLNDTWVVNDRLTLQTGIRWTRAVPNVEDAFSSDNISGSIGFSYALKSNQSQTIRASYSRRSEEPNGAFIVDSLTGGSLGLTFLGDNDLDGIYEINISFPYTPPSEYDGTGIFEIAGRETRFDPDLGPAVQDQLMLSYSAVLPWKLTFDLTGIYTITSGEIKQSEFYNILWENNQPVALREPDKDLLNYVYNDEWSSMHYRSLQLSFTRQFSDGWQLIGSYTWQDQTRKGEWSPYEPERYLYPEDWFEYSHANYYNYSWLVNRGNLSPHLFNFAVSAMMPYGIIFNGNINSRAGYFLPEYHEHFSKTLEFPRFIVLGDGNVVENPYRGINLLAQPRSDERRRMPWVTNVNIGLGKTFDIGEYRYTLQMQVYNLFNDGEFIRPQFVGYTELNPDGELPADNLLFSDIQTPRAVQVYMRVAF